VAEPTPPRPPVGGPPPPEPSDKSVGELIFDVSERTSSLIREEIALAKAEVSEKVNHLVRGSVVGIVAGVFAFLALILFMHGFAWLLNDLFFEDAVWVGFMIEAGLFLLVAAGAGLLAFRAVQAGAPPVPAQAIEEAKRTRAVLEGGGSEAGAATSATGRAGVYGPDTSEKP
jgi:Putative Actinobacterial Holin-X, holin superfamily III